jgi:hypothetical protein
MSEAAESRIPPSLNNLRKWEEENAQVTARGLGDTLDLVDDLRKLYDWIATEACTPRGVSVCPEVVPGIQLLRSSEYHLHSAVLSCLRCHLTDSFAASRMAIESAAVLAKMKRQPTLFNLWVRAGVDDTVAKRYRKETGGAQLFPADEADMKQLKVDYDFCAKQTHPGFVSMVRRLRLPNAADMTVEFHWFDIRPDSRAEPARTFFWIVSTHRRILDVYARIFKLALDDAAWMLRRNSIEATVGVHLAKWMSVIVQRDGSAGPGEVSSTNA